MIYQWRRKRQNPSKKKNQECEIAGKFLPKSSESRDSAQGGLWIKRHFSVDKMGDKKHRR
jgi:hypothetical protein